MAVDYRPSGDDIILDAPSTAWYLSDESIQSEVQALAQKNVDETGRPCDVFADDGVTLLCSARPTKPGVGE